MRIKNFIDELASVRLNGVFNPYRDRCLVSDLAEGPSIRRTNLATYMEAAKSRSDSIWFGRDLGYRGGRRTGLALTDEAHLGALSACYGGIVVSRATVGPAVVERTASVAWSIIRRLQAPPFLWNVFPFHPHEPDDPYSNRCHTAAERKTCEPLISRLVDWLQPSRVIAIGNDAYRALTALGISCEYVRHPSYGGQKEFLRGMESVYDLTADEGQAQNTLL